MFDVVFGRARAHATTSSVKRPMIIDEARADPLRSTSRFVLQMAAVEQQTPPQSTVYVSQLDERRHLCCCCGIHVSSASRRFNATSYTSRQLSCHTK